MTRAGTFLAANRDTVGVQRAAARLQRWAVLRIDRRRPAFGEALTNLGVTYEHLSRLDFPDALTKAVAAHTTALRVIPRTHPARVTVLSNLGAALLERHERDGMEHDLRRATAVLDEALAACPADHADRPALLVNAAAGAYRRLIAFTDPAAVRAGVHWCTEAVDLLPADDPAVADVQVMWGQLLHGFAEVTGTPQELNAAIDRLDSAVQLAIEANGDVPHACTALASALRMRAERIGRADDLDRAVDQLHEAVTLTPATYASALRRRTASLAVAVAVRFQRSRRAVDIDRAIALMEDLVADADDAMPARRHRANLAVCLTERASSPARRPGDLTRAVDLLRGLTTDTMSPETEPGLWAALADALLDRAEETGADDDLRAAWDAASAAISAAPPGSPELARLNGILGEAALGRFHHVGNIEDLTTAIQLYTEAYGVRAAAPRERIRAALLWAHCAATASDWDAVARAHICGSALIPALLAPEIAPLDGLHLVEQLAEAGSDVAAAGIHQGRPGEGLVRAEQWRGLILGPDRRQRAQWRLLKERDPEAADRLEAIRAQHDAVDADPLVSGRVR